MKRGEKNIMKRKVIAITLTAMMAAGMLAGCGSSDSSSSLAADTTKEASATEADGSTAGDSTAAGGDFSGQISVISREDGSGTRGAFIELFGVEEKNDAGEKVDNTTVDAQIPVCGSKIGESCGEKLREGKIPSDFVVDIFLCRRLIVHNSPLNIRFESLRVRVRADRKQGVVDLKKIKIKFGHKKSPEKS